MDNLNHTTRSGFAVLAGARASEVATALMRRRKAIASAEPEDALLTGMTRSLDRRLLALNLRAGSFPIAAALKVA